MNKLTMTINKDAKPVSKKYNCEMEISSEVENSWKEFLNGFLETETLQGERTDLKNGMIRYRMNIPEEKQEMIRKTFAKRILEIATKEKN